MFNDVIGKFNYLASAFLQETLNCLILITNGIKTGVNNIKIN